MTERIEQLTAEPRRCALRIALAVALVSLIVFLRALQCDFVNFDDHERVLDNLVIREFNRQLLVSAFSSTFVDFWLPLTWISYAMDYQVWRLNPFGYHLTNILLHAVNSGLLVLVADRVMAASGFRVSGRGAAGGEDLAARDQWLYPAMLLLAGLVWAIHPLRVESVVWISERKDVLNGFFALASLLAYLVYVEREASGRKTASSYLLALLLFACSLMSKPVTVVFPVMLLVLDWYPLERSRQKTVRPLLLEKLPFLLLSGALSAVTLMAAVDRNLLMTVERLSIGDRFLVSGNALFEYFKQFVVPYGIVPLHPLPHPLPASYTFNSLLVLLVICCCVYWGRSWHALPSTLLLFLLPLLPVIGFLQNGQQAYAARYTYLPHCAVSVAVAVLICRAASRFQVRIGPRPVAAGVVVWLLMLAGMTQLQILVWKNSGTLWTRVIESHPISTAYKSRASYYLLSGRHAEAVTDYTAAMDTATGIEKLEIYNLLAGRGMAFGSMGRFKESIQDLTAAIALYPHPAYYYSRAITYQAMGKQQEANADLMKAGPDPGEITWFRYGRVPVQ